MVDLFWQGELSKLLCFKRVLSLSLDLRCLWLVISDEILQFHSSLHAWVVHWIIEYLLKKGRLWRLVILGQNFKKLILIRFCGELPAPLVKFIDYGPSPGTLWWRQPWLVLIDLDAHKFLGYKL